MFYGTVVRREISNKINIFRRFLLKTYNNFISKVIAICILISMLPPIAPTKVSAASVTISLRQHH